MSTAVLESAESSLVAATASSAVVRTAFYLTSRKEPLLAWLHTTAERGQVDHGVIICPPVGFEQLHSHRSLRHLADAVAVQGIPTLRFDWHGTGDSAGSDADPARRAAWHANVRDAVAWMKQHLGCRRVSVIGLRMGATLAVEALEADDCDNLVLWAPVTCGKAYLRQMQAIEKMAELRPRPVDAAEGDVEAAGFLISAETAEQLAKTNLLQKQLSCLQALVVGPVDKKFVERFSTFDIPVTQLSPPGFAEMMAEPHFSQVPQQAVREIADWLGKKISTAKTEPLTIDLAKLGPAQAILSGPAFGNVCERVLRIGDAALFGVLSEPLAPSNELPAIVLLNAGAANHIGPGRINVEAARHFAAQGFRCLRLDACGLGDSVPANPAEENNPYPPTVFRDVTLALQELQTRHGVKRCVIMGLCSGAYAAFQSAAQLADPALVESILINPLTFHWEDGMPFDASGAQRLMKEHCYMARATNLKKLWKFLRGKTEIGYLEAWQLLRRRVAHSLRKRKSQPADAASTAAGTLGHPAENNLSADLARVASSRRKLTMFLAENDPGYAVMMYHAPRETKHWLKTGALHLAYVSEGDHTFSRRAPRQKLLQTLSEYLRERYPSAAAVHP